MHRQAADRLRTAPDRRPRQLREAFQHPPTPPLPPPAPTRLTTRGHPDPGVHHPPHTHPRRTDQRIPQRRLTTPADDHPGRKRTAHRPHPDFGAQQARAASDSLTRTPARKNSRLETDHADGPNLTKLPRHTSPNTNTAYTYVRDEQRLHTNEISSDYLLCAGRHLRNGRLLRAPRFISGAGMHGSKRTPSRKVERPCCARASS
ncbi:hypothetical protein FMEAI12_7050003 [Parafrankia sp. Ea1.12]|nr:hypothetical protein FMEAI12_7050003 [Parafrankia sp. Ea1.12]